MGTTIITNSVEETINAGKLFAREYLQARTGTVPVLLQGEMGAGKTHFVKGLASGLGITDNITSPTFALVNSYSGLFHFDLFRIHTEEDLYAIGFYDYIGKGIIVIEWAENIPELQQEFAQFHRVKITKTNENTREIVYENIRT
jgi:tRNA threonylcarbamoyladenosine biosynthesis protein TsaE